MRISEVPATVFDTLKRFANSIDGIEKLGNIVSAVAGLVLLGHGPSPVWIQTLGDNFSNYEAFKNSFNWIRTGDGFFSNPYSLKDLTIKKVLITLRRLCFLGVTTLATWEYWNKLNKFTPAPFFPVKFCLLFATTVLSNIISGITLYENSVSAKNLKMKKIVVIDTNDQSVDQNKLTEKMNALATRINELKGSLGQKLANKKVADQNQYALYEAAEKWLAKVTLVNVAPNDYLELKKQLKALKLLKDPTLENLKDVRALNDMDASTFRSLKVEQYTVREENLDVENKKEWRSIAQEIGKMGVFGFLIANAPYLSLIPVDSAFVLNVVSKCVSLVSGLIGFEKFLFESHHEVPKKELRPSEWLLPLPV